MLTKQSTRERFHLLLLRRRWHLILSCRMIALLSGHRIGCSSDGGVNYPCRSFSTPRLRSCDGGRIRSRPPHQRSNGIHEASTTTVSITSQFPSMTQTPNVFHLLFCLLSHLQTHLSFHIPNGASRRYFRSSPIDLVSLITLNQVSSNSSSPSSITLLPSSHSKYTR